MCFHIARRVPFVLFTLLSAGCSTTPLDAVIAEDSGISASDGGADAGVCFVPEPGRFVLESAVDGSCLGAGEPTTVFGNPGFDTTLAADCTLPAQAWDLTLASGTAVYSFKNVGSTDTLDVEMAAVQSGTPVIVYAATGLDNQKFEVRARGVSLYELRPQNVTTSCVAAVAQSAQITTCSESDPTQAWQFERTDCL
jgi:hypothetical protein